MYQPPFTVTPKIIDLISRISEKIGEINSLESDRQHINLRKENRIRTIHSSLAIENNSLSRLRQLSKESVFLVHRMKFRKLRMHFKLMNFFYLLIQQVKKIC